MSIKRKAERGSTLNISMSFGFMDLWKLAAVASLVGAVY